MEENGALTQLVRRFFVLIELVLLVLTVSVLTLLYTQTIGAAFLLVLSLSALSTWYLFKTTVPDRQLGIKARIIYFGCFVSCLAVLFALLWWPGHKILLVVGLAFMAAGWGVFLWSRQRDKDKTRLSPSASYMMFLRLSIYTAGCLYLLFALQRV